MRYPPRLSRSSRYTYPAFPSSSIKCGCCGVPKSGVPLYDDGSATGPPDPKSASRKFRAGASYGVKKSTGLRVLSPWTRKRTTASPRSLGGVDPAVGPVMVRFPFPVASKISPGLSESNAPPACQMPPPQLPLGSVAQRVTI